MPLNIKFSHNYPKLHSQKSARLVHIQLVNRTNMHNDFVQYDASYPDGNGEVGYYPLTGDKLIPFTTARQWTKEKEQYYQTSLGKLFDIVYLSNDVG